MKSIDVLNLTVRNSVSDYLSSKHLSKRYIAGYLGLDYSYFTLWTKKEVDYSYKILYKIVNCLNLEV